MIDLAAYALAIVALLWAVGWLPRRWLWRPRRRRTAYDRYLRSPEWRRKRRAVLDRDGHRCRRCGNRNRRALHVHHRTYRRLFRERLSDLVTLCRRCHRRAHRRWMAPRIPVWRLRRRRMSYR